MQSDTPLRRACLSEMTDDEVDAWVLGIRDRRAHPIKVFNEAKALAKEVRDEKLRERIAQQLKLLDKDQKQIEKAMERVELRTLKIRAIMLEIEG